MKKPVLLIFLEESDGFLYRKCEAYLLEFFDIYYYCTSPFNFRILENSRVGSAIMEDLQLYEFNDCILPDDFPLNEAILADRNFLDKSKAVHTAKKKFFFIENLFIDLKIDAVLSELNFLSSWCFHYQCQKKKRPFLWPWSLPFNGRFFIMSNYSIDAKYKHLNEFSFPNLEGSIGHSILVKDLKEKYSKELPILPHMSKNSFDFRLCFRVLINYFLFLNLKYFVTHIKSVLKKSLRSVKREFRRIYQKRFFQNQVPDTPYWLYFLHSEPDLSLLVEGSDFLDQYSFTRNLLRYLPNDHWLVVREHPLMNGKRKSKFYKRLKNLPSVALVSNSISSVDLIKNAALVVVINGTVGFEALMMRKQVLAFGVPFYKDFCLSLDQLRSGAINSSSINFVDLSGVEFDKFLLKLFMLSYEGNIYTTSRNYLYTEADFRSFSFALIDSYKRFLNAV